MLLPNGTKNYKIPLTKTGSFLAIPWKEITRLNCLYLKFIFKL